MTDPHTLWATAQLLPGEGIEDGVARIAALLAESRNCRNCARMYWTKTKGVIGCESIVTCTSADRHDPLPQVRLWLDNVRGNAPDTAPQTLTEREEAARRGGSR